MKINTELLTDYLNNKCDEQTRRNIEVWREENLAHQSYFEELKFYWECKNHPITTIEFDSDKGFSQLLEKRRSEKKIRFRKLLQYAAVIVFLLAGSLTSFFLYTPSSDQIIVENKSTPEKYIILPDSSTILLTKGSSIRYPKKFIQKERMVYLSGNAFFKVSKNKRKAFVIETENSRTRVLGTSFRIIENQFSTDIRVKTGVVEFMDKNNPDNKVRLLKNETAKFIYKQKVVLKRNLNKKSIQYTIKQLIYENERLDKICKDLSEIYHRDIQLNSEMIRKKSLSATFEDQDLKSILESIAFTLNLEIENKENYILLK